MQTRTRSVGNTSWREAFFTERRLTSKLKHLILTSYVKEFAYHLGSVRPTIYYVDGFAGPGSYGHASAGSEPGSPVLIAEFARQLQGTSARFILKCLNVEEQFYKQLEGATAPFAGQIVEKNYHSPFIDALGDILQRIGNAPAFFFLDPFGTKGIPFRNLLPLFNRKARTEIFITLHTDGIAKKAGWLASLDDADVQKRKTALALTENLAEALYLSRDELRSWWAECVKNGNGGTAAFEQRILQHYRTILRSHHTKLQFTKAFPVYYYGPDAPPGDEASICFYLVFGTQHKKGLYEMNDCMVKALDSFYQQEYSHTFFPLFRDQIDKPKNLDRLQEEILTQFRVGPFTIDQAKQCLMQDSSILISGKYYRDAVIRLRKSGRLEQLDPGQVNNERTRFQVLPRPSESSIHSTKVQ